MDIVTATKIIQEQADENGRSFDDEFWHIARNLKKSYIGEDVYKAWTVFQNSLNAYFSRQADRQRIQELARQMKNFNAEQQAYFDSI